jgi:putative transposase
MPRPLLYPLIGVPQHVIQRGNNRQPTFFIEDDFRFYRECLKRRPPIITVRSMAMC